MNNLDLLVREVDNFPTLPNVATQALEELEREDCDFDEVASLISLDPVLAGRVVRLSNSAFFGAAQRAETVEAAICRLGIVECRNLILTVALMTAIPDLPEPHNAKVFWTASLASALIAEKIAADIGYSPCERAYLAGLVHLIGEAVLAIQFTERFRRAISTSRADQIPFVPSLTEEFGYDHAAVSARILEHWSFRSEVIEAVRNQFSPSQARTDKLLPCLVVMADGVCRDEGLGLEDPTHAARAWTATLPELAASALRAAGHAEIGEYLDSIEEQIKEAIDFASTVF